MHVYKYVRFIDIYIFQRNFWLLPSIFSGNRLGSYGGHIKYSLKYSHEMPKQNSLLSVEILTVSLIMKILNFVKLHIGFEILRILLKVRSRPF